MSGFVCGGQGAPASALAALAGLTACCYGAATDGPLGCTCWEEVYDLDQAEPDSTAEPTTRRKTCEDCAYLPTSPERTGDERYQPPPEPSRHAVFWCHQGMRRAVRYRHRTLGITVETSTHDYRPPLLERGGAMVPYRADGSPGQRCAGWAATVRLDADAVAGLAAMAAE